MVQTLSLFVLLVFGFTSDGKAQDPTQNATADGIRNAIEVGTAFGRITTAEGTIRSYSALTTFYRERLFRPVWNASRLNALVGALQEAAAHALDPREYRVDALRSRLAARVFDVDTELLATDAFMLYGSHLHQGRVNPETLEAEWTANRRNTKMEVVLRAALRADDLAGSLARLAPQQPRYAVLKARYAELSEAGAEDWKPISAGPKLEEGVRDERVIALRNRLRHTNDLSTPGGADPEVFDAALKEALIRFQERSGLEADGVAGSATLRALNRTPAERRAQIAANMERWRWLPDSLGQHHIEVNLAGFDMAVVRNGVVQRRHRVVVGRTYRETPMFSGTMTHLVLAPYWNVPPTIASQDKFPLLKANPSYIAANRMVLFDQATGKAVDPAGIDFSTMSGQEFNRRYRLRQEPGPSNALGDVKFMFPNRHHVYLHDTPTRELFAQSFRGFSSGCVRVEQPLDLAEYLLSSDPSWTPTRIRETIRAGKETTVLLQENIPIHLLYWTVWVDDSGALQFREDHYGRDARVLAALAVAPSQR